MVVVGAWRRNDSRIGGLHERTISNLDKDVLASIEKSPVSMSINIHWLCLEASRRLSRDAARICSLGDLTKSQCVVKGLQAIPWAVQPGHVRLILAEASMCLKDGRSKWQEFK